MLDKGFPVVEISYDGINTEFKGGKHYDSCLLFLVIKLKKSVVVKASHFIVKFI